MRSNTWTRAEHLLLVKMAHAGASYESICNVLSRHPRRVVWQKLKKAGFDAIAAQALGCREKLARDERDKEIAALAETGMSQREIGERVGMTQGGINSAFRRLGLQGNPPNEACDLCEIKGLPKGHLKPWPQTAKFTSLALPSDPHRVAASIHPNPSYSSGVAEYGHV